jgi:hypothetical protein
MQYDIVSIALGIVLFLCLYAGFKTGLRLGMQAAKGEIPKPINNPITAITNSVEASKAKKKVEAISDEWEEMSNYDGYTDEERKLVYGNGG